jgi:hypothetical protein
VYVERADRALGEPRIAEVPKEVVMASLFHRVASGAANPRSWLRAAFRSEESGAFTTLTYYGAAALAGVALSALILTSWSPINTVILDLNYAVWADTGSAPSLADPATFASLKSAVSELSNQIQNDVRNGGNNNNSVALVGPDRYGSCPGPEGTMFRDPSIDVSPYCVSYWPKSLSPIENLAFRSFAAHVEKIYRRRWSGSSQDVATERTLAQALGLHGGTDGGGAVAVPWIYLAARSGAIAVFPARKLGVGRQGVEHAGSPLVPGGVQLGE